MVHFITIANIGWGHWEIVYSIHTAKAIDREAANISAETQSS